MAKTNHGMVGEALDLLNNTHALAGMVVIQN